MAKLKEFNMNMDISIIAPESIDRFLMKPPTDEQKKNHQKELKEWAGVDPKDRGEQPQIEKEHKTGAEFVMDTIEQALNQAHPSGNVQVLRRTRSIMAELEGAIESKEKSGVVLLQPDDFTYVNKAFGKSDKWVNNKENAIVLCAVDELLQGAKDVEV